MTQQIKISDFSKGLVQDIDDTTESMQNSVNDCLNVDFNTTIGAVEKRKSIEYTTNWTYDSTDLDMGSGYTPTKIFDFVGADNNIIQIVCGVATGNVWKIWYKVGDTDWVPFGGTGNTYTLNTGDEPQFQSLDGACRIAMGEKVTPKILFYKDGTWYTEEAYPGITISFVNSGYDSFELLWDPNYTLTFSVPSPTIWPINTIVGGSSNSYDSKYTGTGALTVNKDENIGEEAELYGETLKKNLLQAIDLILDIWDTTDNEGTGLDFYSAYAIDSIEPEYNRRDIDGREFVELVGLRVRGHVRQKTSVVKSFISGASAGYPWVYGTWFTGESVGDLSPILPTNTPIGTYSFKVTAIFDNNETMPLKECTVTPINSTDVFVVRVKYKYTDISKRFRAIRVYRKYTADKLETKNISETGYRLIREIAFDKFTPNENDKSYVPSTGLGSDPWKWLDDTTTTAGVTYKYMDMLFHDKNIFIGTGTLFDIMQDYRTEEIKHYKDAIYLGGRRYIFGCDAYKDRVYFSTIVSEVPYPQLDIFAGHNYFSVGDNEVITKILVWRDNILVFTEQNIYYVVTQDTDYKITDSFIGQGTEYPNTVVIVPRGIIWANDRGIFIFEGSAPRNISIGRWEKAWLDITDKTVCFAGYCKYNNSYWLSVSSSVIMVYNADMDYWTKYQPVAINGYKRFYLGTTDGIFYLVTYTSNTIKICSFPGNPNTGTDYYKHDDSYVIPAYIITQRLYDNNDIQKVFTKVDIKCLFDDSYYRPILTYKVDGIEVDAAGVGSTWNSTTEGYITLPIPDDKTIKEITVPIPTGIASDIQIKVLSVGDVIANKNFRIKSILVYYEPLEELKHVHTIL